MRHNTEKLSTEKLNTEQLPTVEDVELVDVNALSAGSAAAKSDESVVGAERYLDVVKDVEITLTASLGAAQLTVGELFSMKNGGVITLNKNSAEPIELFLNDPMVAKGSLVVVGDNFGIQVTEISDI